MLVKAAPFLFKLSLPLQLSSSTVRLFYKNCHANSNTGFGRIVLYSKALRPFASLCGTNHAVSRLLNVLPSAFLNQINHFLHCFEQYILIRNRCTSGKISNPESMSFKRTMYQQSSVFSKRCTGICGPFSMELPTF